MGTRPPTTRWKDGRETRVDGMGTHGRAHHVGPHPSIHSIPPSKRESSWEHPRGRGESRVQVHTRHVSGGEWTDASSIPRLHNRNGSPSIVETGSDPFAPHVHALTPTIHPPATKRTRNAIEGETNPPDGRDRPWEWWSSAVSLGSVRSSSPSRGEEGRNVARTMQDGSTPPRPVPPDARRVRPSLRGTSLLSLSSLAATCIVVADRSLPVPLPLPWIRVPRIPGVQARF